MGASKGLQQLLSLLSQCLAWVLIVGFTFLFLQHQKDGLYIFTVVGFQAALLVVTIFCRDVAGRSSFICWSVQALTDPVLSCLALTPLVLVDKVPGILYTKECLAQLDKGYTDLKCLNHTLVQPMGTWANTLLFNKQIRNHEDLDHVLDIQMIVLSLAMLMPVILSLIFYKPWIPWRMHVFGGIFWLLQTLDCVAFLETAVLDPSFQTVVTLASLAKAVFIILSTGFVLSTPLFLVSMMKRMLVSSDQSEREPTREPTSYEGFDVFNIDGKVVSTYRDLYIRFVVLLDLSLWEIPDIGAKALILSKSNSVVLPGSFYCSLVKNILFVVLLGICTYKLFRFHSKCNKSETILSEQSDAEEVVQDESEQVVVMVNLGTNRDVALRPPRNIVWQAQQWDRFVSIYGVVSCLVLVGTMIGAVCLYNV